MPVSYKDARSGHGFLDPDDGFPARNHPQPVGFTAFVQEINNGVGALYRFPQGCIHYFFVVFVKAEDGAKISPAGAHQLQAVRLVLGYGFLVGKNYSLLVGFKFYSTDEAAADFPFPAYGKLLLI
ncbi:MAG: hypothetical protein BWY80_00688 [Firmicutes bacterium ADurb.Bin456]|nr:MAG: hypothetical protein BWY80_00688 [Firmicutes bacterium ADurb.Bin456]